MKKPRRAEYTPLDFAQWKASNSLSLTPKFQRRGVWKPAARSFFVDSLLRGMPVPPIYLREMQSPKRDRVIREVVDGQQRIAAVLDFTEGRYRLAKTLKGSWAGKTFNALPTSTTTRGSQQRDAGDASQRALRPAASQSPVRPLDAQT